MKIWLDVKDRDFHCKVRGGEVQYSAHDKESQGGCNKVHIKTMPGKIEKPEA